MKRIVLVTLLLLLSNFVKADKIPLDSIRQTIVIFLQETEVVSKEYKFSEYSYSCIEAKTKKEIDDGEKGIYLFFMMSSVGYVHFLLVDDDSFEIVNMSNILFKNVNKFISFFEKNKEYTRDDIVDYLKEFVRIKELNDKKISQHLYIIDDSGKPQK